MAPPTYPTLTYVTLAATTNQVAHPDHFYMAVANPHYNIGHDNIILYLSVSLSSSITSHCYYYYSIIACIIISLLFGSRMCPSTN